MCEVKKKKRKNQSTEIWSQHSIDKTWSKYKINRMWSTRKKETMQHLLTEVRD
jgi:hypothetical protein